MGRFSAHKRQPSHIRRPAGDGTEAGAAYALNVGAIAASDVDAALAVPIRVKGNQTFIRRKSGMVVLCPSVDDRDDPERYPAAVEIGFDYTAPPRSARVKKQRASCRTERWRK